MTTRRRVLKGMSLGAGSVLLPAMVRQIVAQDDPATMSKRFVFVLLDQFTRNLYRNTVDAYSGDALAFEIMASAIRSMSLALPARMKRDAHGRNCGM